MSENNSANLAKILLVDDDPAILEAVTDLLEVNQFVVVTATDGSEAISMMDGFVPDLIISDIAMPVMDGYEFFDHVRQNPNWIAIPFIFLTARGQPVDIHLGYNLGADDYLVKPFEPDDLIVKVQSRLRRMRDLLSATHSEVEQIKQQLVTVFSHEIRTPLTSIYGYSNLLQDDHTNIDDKTMDQMLGEITKGADRLRDLMENMILLARIDSRLVNKEVGTYSGPVDMTIVIRKVVNDLQPFAEQKNVGLTLQAEEGLIVQGMESYLGPMCKYLVENGIKFCKRGGGNVQVVLAADEDRVLLIVTDDGIGIQKSDQKRIFERFEQVNRQEMEQQGPGVGLTLARGLAGAHGGDVIVESEMGKGSRFTIWLPRQEI